MEHGERNTPRADEGFDLALVAIDEYDDPEFPSDLGCVTAGQTVKAALADLGAVVAECPNGQHHDQGQTKAWLEEQSETQSS